MSTECDIENPLKRDGTAQEAREIDALQPANVEIDGRSKEDIATFARELAELFQFYDTDYNLVGDWSVFFGEDLDESEPHFALFCAFLEVFEKSQNHLNDLTGKHLDFYYKDVLQLQKKAATPDKAHIIFELAKNVTEHKVEADTELSAGKDDTKVELIYETDKEIVVNVATVEQLKTIYLETDEDANDQLVMVYASDTANSSDGVGGELDEDDPRWPSFGETQFNDSGSELAEDDRTMPDANIGFAMASPAL